MSKIWLIADTHFGHDKMQQYCGRPEEFEFLIGSKWKKLINDEDIVIHLGDICIGNDAKWHEDFIKKLPGRKILTRGNHDKKSNQWYMTHGWDFVCNNFSITFNGKKIVFSHAPVCLSGNDFNIHGHFHNNLHRLLEGRYVIDGEKERNEKNLLTLTSSHINISIEETKYNPVLLTKKLFNIQPTPTEQEEKK